MLCSVVSDSATPLTVACQTPLFMEFSRQEYWSGLPFPYKIKLKLKKKKVVERLSCIFNPAVFSHILVSTLYVWSSLIFMCVF